MPEGKFDQADGVVNAQFSDEVLPVCLYRAYAKE